MSTAPPPFELVATLVCRLSPRHCHSHCYSHHHTHYTTIFYRKASHMMILSLRSVECASQRPTHVYSSRLSSDSEVCC